MKAITEQIQQLLANLKAIDRLEDYLTKNPDMLFQDTRVSELLVNFQMTVDTFKLAIENGDLDNLPFAIRNEIKANISTLERSQQHIDNNFFTYMDRIYQLALNSGLFSQGITSVEIVSKLKELTKLKRRYTEHINEFRASKKNLQQIEDLRKEYNSLIAIIKEREDTIKQSLEEAQAMISLMEGQVTNAKTREEQINTTRKDVEEKAIKINSFEKNITEYENRIENLVQQSEALLKREADINKLISQAEKALDLKSAEGISAAFSSEYAKVDDKIIYRGWLIGAGFFIVMAIALTVWIVSGWGIKEGNEIASIIGRVVAVAISVAGATFCANQYTKQKNLAADYAYKATLSKSIIAFKGEIQKNSKDGKEVSEYLTQVLAEIHKDPMRNNSKTEDSTVISSEHITLIEKIKALVK